MQAHAGNAVLLSAVYPGEVIVPSNEPQVKPVAWFGIECQDRRSPYDPARPQWEHVDDTDVIVTQKLYPPYFSNRVTAGLMLESR
jgi:hypothetical protein